MKGVSIFQNVMNFIRLIKTAENKLKLTTKVGKNHVLMTNVIFEKEE
jgi:hypothetical protein